MSRTLSMSRYSLLIGAALLMLAATTRAQGTFEIVPVARLGDPVVAPATLVGASQPRLNDAGEILFRGDGGLFLTSPEGLIVVAAPGDAAPDGRLIAAIGAASVNVHGQVAFVVSFGPSGTALLLFTPGQGTEIIHTAGPLFGFLGNFPLISPSLNAQGHIAFIEGVTILVYADGAVSEVVRRDHPAIQPGVPITLLSSVRLNDAGHLAFSTSAPEPGAPVGADFPLGVYSMVDGEVRLIADRGTATPDGGTFDVAVSPSLNARGDVAFTGLYRLPSIPSQQTGIFVFSDGALTLLVRSGDVVGDSTLSSVGGPTIDDQGQVAFSGSVATGGPSGIFLFGGGIVRRLVSTGDVTAEGDTLPPPISPSFNALGQLAFAVSVAPFGRVYRLTDDLISRVAVEGDVIPAIPRIVSASTNLVRSIGQAVYVASIFPGVSGIVDLGGVRARVGDNVPGGGVISSFFEVASSDVGAIAFRAQLSLPSYSAVFLTTGEGTLSEVARDGFAPSVNASGDVAFLAQGDIFLNSGGTIAPLVSRGDPAPGGETFVGFFPNTLSLNDSTHVAFVGNVGQPPLNRAGVFVSAGGEVTAVAQTGDPAPGGGTFTTFGSVQLNAAGQVGFTAGANGIFLFTGNVIHNVARSGDPAPGGGDLTTLDSAISLNRNGHVAFSSSLTGGAPLASGAFVSIDGGIEAVARSGDPAGGEDTFTSARDPKISADGQIFFTGTTASTGTGVFLARRSAPERQVSIAIRPAGSANRIDPASTERIPVAILSDADFDAQTVIVDTVRFGPTGTEATPVRGVARDVDGDGDIDLVLRFQIQDTGIQCGQTSARLTGQTVNNVAVSGSDAIRTVRCQ